MIGRDDAKGARLWASRLEIRVDDLEDKLDRRHDEIEELRDELRDKEDKIRYLRRALDAVDDELAELAAIRRRLAERNLDVPWLPDHEPDPSRPDRQVASIRRTLGSVRDAAEHLEGLLDGDGLAEPTDAVDVLADRIGERTVAEVAASEAPTVVDLYRTWIDADPMDRYRRELLDPYADAVERLLGEDPDETTVAAAKAALPLLKDAFDESRTYMLRRSAVLDDHDVDVDVRAARFDQDPALAVERLDAVVEQARALGAVDFFHNLLVQLRDALDGGEEGAGPAAWLLADVTADVLGDATVKAWIERGIG